jgi:hypothetical protein
MKRRTRGGIVFFLFQSTALAANVPPFLGLGAYISHELLHFDKEAWRILDNFPGNAFPRTYETIRVRSAARALKKSPFTAFDRVDNFLGDAMLLLSLVDIHVFISTFKDELAKPHIAFEFCGWSSPSHEYVVFTDLHDHGIAIWSNLGGSGVARFALVLVHHCLLSAFQTKGFLGRPVFATSVK